MSDNDDCEMMVAAFFAHQQSLLTAVEVHQSQIDEMSALCESEGLRQLPESGLPRIRRYVKNSTHWEDMKNLPEKEFIKRYRLSRQLFYEVLEKIEPYIRVDEMASVEEPISPEVRFAVFLKYICTGDSPITVSDLFGIGKSTTYNIIYEVAEAINEVYNNDTTFHFPNTEEEFEEKSRNFFLKSQFPLTIGALDDTHIPIRKPDYDPASYRNYKGFESIHVQCVCDHKTKILFHHTGMPGKNHDSFVFRRGGLSDMLKQVPRKYHVIADPAYPLSMQLMKRYAGDCLPVNEEHYNYRQSRARMLVESLYGRLKGRFRCLLSPINFPDLNNVVNIVVACLVLHNLITDTNLDWFPGYCGGDDYENLMNEFHVTSRDSPAFPGRGMGNAKMKRDLIRDFLQNQISEEECIRILNMNDS